MLHLFKMIKSFRHKGLKLFYETGNHKGIQPDHAQKLARILDRLDSAISPKDMNLPGYNLHQLTGKEKGTWSVWVNGNWRVIFNFENDNATNINYIDYH